MGFPPHSHFTHLKAPPQGVAIRCDIYHSVCTNPCQISRWSTSRTPGCPWKFQEIHPKAWFSSRFFINFPERWFLTEIPTLHPYVFWVFPKIVVFPPNHPLKNRGFPLFSPSILGENPIFGNTHLGKWSNLTSAYFWNGLVQPPTSSFVAYPPWNVWGICMFSRHLKTPRVPVVFCWLFWSGRPHNFSCLIGLMKLVELTGNVTVDKHVYAYIYLSYISYIYKYKYIVYIYIYVYT